MPKQESIPVRCIAPACWPSPPGYIPPPLEATHWMPTPQSQIPLEADPNSHVACGARWEALHPRPTPSCGQMFKRLWKHYFAPNFVYVR